MRRSAGRVVASVLVASMVLAQGEPHAEAKVDTGEGLAPVLFSAEENYAESVYGPPPSFYEEQSEQSRLRTALADARRDLEELIEEASVIPKNVYTPLSYSFLAHALETARAQYEASSMIDESYLSPYELRAALEGTEAAKQLLSDAIVRLEKPSSLTSAEARQTNSGELVLSAIIVIETIIVLYLARRVAKTRRRRVRRVRR